LHAILRGVAPKAKVQFKWGIPFFVEPRFLFAFKAHKAHLSLAPSAAALAHFRKELRKHETTRGTFRIYYNKPLPGGLVRKIAEWRLREVGKREGDAFW
jgi:uncharacterized protein YdhG (YjbR/CyaY superfamily)